MFKARNVNTRQGQIPVRVCDLYFQPINVHDAVARIEKCLAVLLIRSHFAVKIAQKRSRNISCAIRKNG